MSPLVLIQIGCFLFAAVQAINSFNVFKVSGDQPSSVDWMSILLPAVLSFIAPYLKKFFPWLPDGIFGPTPTPTPSPIPIPVPDDGSTPSPIPRPSGIDWGLLIPVLIQILPLVFKKDSLKLVHLNAILEDSSGKLYPINYGTPPVDPMTLLVPASSLRKELNAPPAIPTTPTV